MSAAWVCWSLAVCVAAGMGCAGGDGSRTGPGSPAPDFRAITIDGETFQLADLRGNVVWINFFATWCGPCMNEMPRLQREVWERYGQDDFVLLAIGREHTVDELRGLRQSARLTLPLVPDPKREIYDRYAGQSIPRNYILDRDGRIVHQSIGYGEEDFSAMVRLVRRLLDEGRGAT